MRTSHVPRLRRGVPISDVTVVLPRTNRTLFHLFPTTHTSHTGWTTHETRVVPGCRRPPTKGMTLVTLQSVTEDKDSHETSNTPVLVGTHTPNLYTPLYGVTRETSIVW